jgi:hypothetical protein
MQLAGLYRCMYVCGCAFVYMYPYAASGQCVFYLCMSIYICAYIRVCMYVWPRPMHRWLRLLYVDIYAYTCFVRVHWHAAADQIRVCGCGCRIYNRMQDELLI